MDIPPAGVVLDSKPPTAPPTGVVLDSAPAPGAATTWNGVGLPPLGTGALRNPRTGQIEHAAPAGSIPILDAPIVGIPQAVRGGRELATRGERERGAADAIEGVLNTASIALPAAAAEEPLAISLGLATGTGAAKGTQFAARELGASPDAARLAGDVGGVVAGGLAGKRFISPEEAGVPDGVALDAEVPTEPPSGVVLDDAAVHRAYNALPESHGGKLLSADLYKRALVDNPSPDRETSIAQHSAVHERSAELAREAFLDRLESGDGPAVGLVGGAPGAGKSSVLQSGIAEGQRAAIDSTLADYPSTKALLDAALTKGVRPQFTLVHAPPEVLAGRVLERSLQADDDGVYRRRLPPPEYLASRFVGAGNTAAHVAAEYGGRADLAFADNSVNGRAPIVTPGADAVLQGVESGGYNQPVDAIADQIRAQYLAAGARAPDGTHADWRFDGGGGVAGTPSGGAAATGADQAIPGAAYLASREKLAPKLTVPTTQLDPSAQANASRVGLFHFQNGSADYDTWAKSMVQDVGDGIAPNLKSVWDRVQRRVAMDKLAGNINLDRLNTAEDVKDAIRQTAAANPDALAAQTRGSILLASTADAAKQLVADGLIQEKDVANITKGTAWNAQQLNAARGVMLSLQEKSRDAQMAWQAAPTDENLAAFRDAVARAGAVQQSVAGLTAEAGRALSSMRIMGDVMRKRSGIEQALNTLGGRELNEQAARALASIPDGDSVGLAKFIRSQNQWTTQEKVQAYWTASLLSSPKTMAAKMVGDATMAALDAPVRVVRGVTDAAMAKVAGRSQQYFAGEALPALAGWFHGLGGGFQDALQLLQHGYSAARAENVVGGVEAPRYELPGGGVNPMNWGPRFLEAATDMMRAAGSRAELEAGAYRMAKGENLAGTALKLRMADILAQPPDELVNQAAEFSKKQTFTNNTPLLQRLTTALDFQTAGGWRPLRFFVPFARVPYNIFARGIELTPAGVAAGVAKGDADLTARGLIGSFVLGTAAHWAANGNLTGAAPQDPRDRAAFYASGKQPYSVRVGDHWVSYERNFGVLGMPMAAAAAFKARYDKQGNAPAPEEIQQAMGGLLHMFAALPMVSGINTVAQAMNDPQRFGSGLVSTLASGFVPFSAGLRVGAHLQDPSMRDARGVYQRILSGIPFAQESLPVRYDPMGRPDIARGNAGPLNAVLPSPVSSTSPVGAEDAEAARLGVYPAATERTVLIGNRRTQLTSAQAQAYQKAVGQAQQQAAQNAMGQPGYWQQSDEERRQQLKYAMAYARRDAEAQFRAQLARGAGH